MRAVPPTGTIDEDGRSSRRLSARRVNRTAFRRVWAQVAVDDVPAPEPPRKNEDAGRKPQLTLAELVEDSGEQLRQRLLPQAPQPAGRSRRLALLARSASRWGCVQCSSVSTPTDGACAAPEGLGPANGTQRHNAVGPVTSPTAGSRLSSVEDLLAAQPARHRYITLTTRCRTARPVRRAVALEGFAASIAAGPSIFLS